MEHRGRRHIEKAMGALVQNIKSCRAHRKYMGHGRGIGGMGEGIGVSVQN